MLRVEVTGVGDVLLGYPGIVVQRNPEDFLRSDNATNGIPQALPIKQAADLYVTGRTARGVLGRSRPNPLLLKREGIGCCGLFAHD